VKLWIFIAATVVLVVVATLYDARREIAEETEEPVDLTPQRQLYEVKSYYRTHRLPVAWTIGEIFEDAGCIRVNLHFVPSVNSARYGQVADTAEITQETGCPQLPDVWSKIGDRGLCLALHDRTGPVGEMRCQQAGS
jgi:hypothetical protein